MVCCHASDYDGDRRGGGGSLPRLAIRHARCPYVLFWELDDQGPIRLEAVIVPSSRRMLKALTACRLGSSAQVCLDAKMNVNGRDCGGSQWKVFSSRQRCLRRKPRTVASLHADCDCTNGNECVHAESVFASRCSEEARRSRPCTWKDPGDSGMLRAVAAMGDQHPAMIATIKKGR